MKRNPINAWLLSASFGLVPGVQPAQAQTFAKAGLADLSLEDILNVEVTSVSRKAERLQDTASAVHVITAEDIRRSGALSIPEALRMAPGVEVARNAAGQYAITARGINGRFANKLLVLMDGRSVYSPLFSGVLWENEDTMMEDIERIEVIRGPHAAMWGANAVNGVINIITRSARETAGGLVAGNVGSLEKGGLSLRYGGALGDNAHWRVYAKGLERGPMVDLSGNSSGDPHRSSRVGFRIDGRGGDGGGFTVLGDAHQSSVRDQWTVPTIVAPYSSNLAFKQETTGFNLLARRDFQFASGSKLSLQGWYMHTHISAPAVVSESRDTADLDVHHGFKIGQSHDFNWGLNYRHSSDSTIGSSMVSFVPASRRLNWTSLYFHDDWTLVPEHLRLIVGARFERESYSGLSIQPNARLSWMPDTLTTIWGSLSRGARTPSRADRDGYILQPTIPPGTPINPGPLPIVTRAAPGGMSAEKLDAFEMGWRRQWTRRLSTDFAAYYSRYNGIRGIRQDPPQLVLGAQPYLLADLALVGTTHGETKGIEASVDWRSTDALRFQLTYSNSVLRFRNAAGQEDPFTRVFEGSSPRQQVSLRSSIDLSPRQQLDIWVRHVGALSEGNIPAYSTLDVRYGWRWDRNLELSVTAQNLLDRHHQEFAQDNILALNRQVPRSVYVRASYKF
jgi:iron complex outermembrane recepter protein